MSEGIDESSLVGTEVASSRSDRLWEWLARDRGTALVLTSGVLLVYVATRQRGSPFDQYARLAEAMLQGRLYVADPPAWLELARVGSRGFVIDPPGPALLLLPWALVGTPDQTWAAPVIGAAAAGLLYVATGALGWTRRFRVAMTLLAALGTNMWWVSTDGTSWTIAHAAAVMFMAAAMLASVRDRPAAAGALFGMAVMSRLPVVLAFPFFAYLLVRDKPRDRLVAVLVRFFVPVAVVGGLFLVYNLARFGDPLATGYFHEQYASEPWFARGRFHPTYVVRHINVALFLPPQLREGEWPPFRPSVSGLGLFFTTPALLYAFGARLRPLQRAALVALALTALPLVTHGATGWAQFGYRYSLDLLPMLVVLVASGMRGRLNRMKVAVITASVVVNLWGVLSFNLFGWKV